MMTLVTDQGTAISDAALCNKCYPNSKNKMYARAMVLHTDDVDSNGSFVDCSENEAIYCCICGTTAVNRDCKKCKSQLACGRDVHRTCEFIEDKIMTVEEALKLIVKNKGIASLNYAIGYAEFALQLIFHGEHNTQGFKTQLLYVLNNMTHWKQTKLSTITAAEIRECRAVLKKASL